MKTLSITIVAAIAVLVGVSCSDTETSPMENAQKSVQDVQKQASSPAARERIPNQLAYYDAELFTINLAELSDRASASIIAHNQSLNEIYASEDLDEPQTFRPVIDAIPADGFNPMWLQFLIVFNDGATPHQFYSDTEVEAAEESGEITLVNTGEVYRCAVFSHDMPN